MMKLKLFLFTLFVISESTMLNVKERNITSSRVFMMLSRMKRRSLRCLDYGNIMIHFSDIHMRISKLRETWVDAVDFQSVVYYTKNRRFPRWRDFSEPFHFPPLIIILLSTSAFDVADVMMTNCARFVIDKFCFTICILMTSPFASRSVTGTRIPCGFSKANLHKQQIFHRSINIETKLYALIKGTFFKELRECIYVSEETWRSVLMLI